MSSTGLKQRLMRIVQLILTAMEPKEITVCGEKLGKVLWLFPKHSLLHAH